MATMYCLVMRKNENDDYWKCSAKGSRLSDIKSLPCYRDPLSADFPKNGHPGTVQEEIRLRRCDLEELEDGKIYLIENV